MEPLMFPDPFILDPISEHRDTIIMLHGRGSNGPEFAKDLLESQLSSGLDLGDLLPNHKWIFPTCPLRYAAAFEEEITQWYEIKSLIHPGTEQEDQVDGIHAALEYILTLVTREAQASPSGGVILGGISQGFSIAVLAALTSAVSLRALVGFSSWLPRFSEIQAISSGDEDQHEKRARVSQKLTNIFMLSHTQILPFNSLSMFLAHCSDDSVVDVAHGTQMKDVLINLGHGVTWLETMDGGHWVNEPEGVDGLEKFLKETALIID